MEQWNKKEKMKSTTTEENAVMHKIKVINGINFNKRNISAKLKKEKEFVF